MSRRRPRAEMTPSTPSAVTLVALGLVTLAFVAAQVAVGSPAASGKTNSSCSPDKFDCRNGKCISGTNWCDGLDDCGNNADELSCRICLSGSVKCKASTQCVPSGARCNGLPECQDGSDELGCVSVTETVRWNVTQAPPNIQASGGSSIPFLSISVLLFPMILYYSCNGSTKY